MAKFKFGEVVQLRSGGPEMTVINVIEKANAGHWKMYVMQWQQENPAVATWYQTQWFEGTTLKKDIFIEEALDSAEGVIF